MKVIVIIIIIIIIIVIIIIIITVIVIIVTFFIIMLMTKSLKWIWCLRTEIELCFIWLLWGADVQLDRPKSFCGF